MNTHTWQKALPIDKTTPEHRKTFDLEDIERRIESGARGTYREE